MATFSVNGKMVTVEENQKLLLYLRDQLHLTSVKNGCSEGACGTCMVLVDGKPMKACVQQTAKLEGKHVLTVEGLTPRERDVYAYAFAKAGAVQCGYCIPGMVISAKGLLDSHPLPTRDEVREAIKNNICRCTGYKKIMDAILLAAELFASGEPVPSGVIAGTVGDNVPRVDAPGKTLGTAKYADDLYFDQMAYASAVRSAYPRAKVLSIDTSAAKAVSGVINVYTSVDVPGDKIIGHLIKDYDVMIPVGKVTHFLGDAIALVVAETKEALAQGKAAVKVEYEPLSPVLSPEESRRDGAPAVHEGKENLLTFQCVKRGSAAEAIRRIRSQNPAEHTEALSDYILSSDAPLKQLRKNAAA